MENTSQGNHQSADRDHGQFENTGSSSVPRLQTGADSFIGGAVDGWQSTETREIRWLMLHAVS